MRLDLLYANRFDARDEAFKARVWAILWRRVFSRWIGPRDVLLDVGGGYCELANAARARRRIVVDLNPLAPRHAAPGVEVHLASAEAMGFLGDGEVDVVFSSNFFEHLPDKGSLTRVLGEMRRVLRPGGRLLAVGPNVRLMPGSYWDWYDHHLPLSERSLAEALLMCGFALERVDPRFLPATTRSRLPRWPWLVEAWLALRPLSSLLTGRQFLLVARRPAEAGRGP
ncbi:MAG TPA: class I SAM-dependent methyltransferase [Anaeromyxobacteraceae bacterium]|nr:class I SAM-dependent methyltransferase [Anaeromyxobacteraceae bacterium]